VVPAGWFVEAGSKQADIGEQGRGYGYQWWTYDNGTFGAQGIFGQGIFIDPARRMVIASNANWPVASDDAYWTERELFYRAVQAAVDARQPR
jgi:CubicO group peptidase (beta-lactamase class C family)